MNSIAEQIIVDIIATYMELNSQNVWVRDQNFKIPNTNDLFVIVGLVDSQIMAVNKQNEAITSPINSMSETMTVISRENIQIDVMSRSLDAIQRRAEVLMALASTYSVQKQEENSFKIFKVPVNFVNTSSAEGGSNLNRFSLTISAHVWYKKTKNLALGDIYTSFDTRVDDAVTIGEADGLIEFTIN